MRASNTVRILILGMAITVMSGLGTIVKAEDGVQTHPLVVAATPTLKAAFHEIVPMFEREYGASVHVVYGASQTLRRQIEKGAPIDVFLPGSAEDLIKLQKKGLTINGGPRIYAETSLVLVTSASSRALSISLRDVLPNTGTRIALGDPSVSALGAITARAFAKLDPAYKSRFNVHYAQHSEDIVNLVHSGEVDLGIVYRTDAITNGQLRIMDEAPVGAHMPVQFGEAVVWTCRNESLKLAEEFYDFIASPRIQKLLLKYGFDPVTLNAAQG